MRRSSTPKMNDATRLFPDITETGSERNDRIVRLVADAETLDEDARSRHNGLINRITRKYIRDYVKWLQEFGQHPQEHTGYSNCEAIKSEIRILQKEIDDIERSPRPLLPGFRNIGETGREGLNCPEALSAARHLLVYWTYLLEGSK